ncbi:MAG: hypothetical protein HQL53_06530 [Magnetococcales bacterium]|nr:hypothetical protein [Magnetococcales bacterium]
MLRSLHEIITEALDRTTPVQEEEKIPIHQGLGRVLADAVMLPDQVADFDQSTVDGYAIAYSNLSPNRLSTFRVIADLAPGESYGKAIGLFEAVQVRSGSPVPEGCDCIVLHDVVKHEPGRIVVPPGQKRQQNIQFSGSAMQQEKEAIGAGALLGAEDLGALLGLDQQSLTVVGVPKVAVFSSGAHALMLSGMLTEMGMEVVSYPCSDGGDDLEAFEALLLQAASEADAVICMDRLTDAALEKRLARVAEIGEVQVISSALEPSIQSAFGRIRGRPFFNLQGDPVSTWIHLIMTLRPALFRLMGVNQQPEAPRFECAFRGRFQKKNERITFLPGRVHFSQDGSSWVEISGATGGEGPLVMAGLIRSNALILLPEGVINLVSGDRVTVQLIRC